MKAKVCRVCGLEKSVDEFPPRNDSPDGYRNDCRLCRRKYQREWELTHREQDKERLRVYYEEHTALAKRRATEWRLSHPERRRRNNRRWAHRNPDKAAASAARYRQDHPREYAVYAQKRRARKREAEGGFSGSEWKELCRAVGERCVACGERRRLTIDHIEPLSIGGTNSIENIQPLCGRCNSAKGTNSWHFLAGYDAT